MAGSASDPRRISSDCKLPLCSELDKIRYRLRLSHEDMLTPNLADLYDEHASALFGFLIKLWEGLTFDGIAEVLEIPLNTAASRYRYGLDKLRAQLRPLYNEIR